MMSKRVSSKLLWRQRWAIIAAEARGTKMWGLAGLALVLVALFLFMSPYRHVDVIRGELSGYRAQASMRVPVRAIVRATLDDGTHVIVGLPPGFAYLAHAEAEIEVRRGLWWPHGVTYRFVRYVEDGP